MLNIAFIHIQPVCMRLVVMQLPSSPLDRDTPLLNEHTDGCRSVTRAQPDVLSRNTPPRSFDAENHPFRCVTRGVRILNAGEKGIGPRRKTFLLVLSPWHRKLLTSSTASKHAKPLQSWHSSADALFHRWERRPTARLANHMPMTKFTGYAGAATESVLFCRHFVPRMRKDARLKGPPTLCR